MSFSSLRFRVDSGASLLGVYRCMYRWRYRPQQNSTHFCSTLPHMEGLRIPESQSCWGLPVVLLWLFGVVIPCLCVAMSRVLSYTVFKTQHFGALSSYPCPVLARNVVNAFDFDFLCPSCLCTLILLRCAVSVQN